MRAKPEPQQVGGKREAVPYVAGLDVGSGSGRFARSVRNVIMMAVMTMNAVGVATVSSSPRTTVTAGCNARGSEMSRSGATYVPCAVRNNPNRTPNAVCSCATDPRADTKCRFEGTSPTARPWLRNHVLT